MTLKHSPLTELIHAVLDGEASDAEARELELRLAADPAARAEFEDWKRLFEALDAVPKEHAPEGLVASIASAMPEAPGAPDAASQPFPGRRVLGHTLFGISRRDPTRSITMIRAEQPQNLRPPQGLVGRRHRCRCRSGRGADRVRLPASQGRRRHRHPGTALSRGPERQRTGAARHSRRPGGTDQHRARSESRAGREIGGGVRVDGRQAQSRDSPRLTADKAQSRADGRHRRRCQADRRQADQ